jgi:hypothetical protein
MATIAPHTEETFDRRVFQGWSIAIPVGMEETFIGEDGYWHAWSDARSITLSSIVVTDRRGDPVPARDILAEATPMDGVSVPVPNDIPGWARSIEVPDVSWADRALSGILVVDGNVLIVTVTSDDPEWNKSVWRSIRHHQASPGRRPQRA